MTPTRRPRKRKVSARQRVGGLICDKTEKPEFSSLAKTSSNRQPKALLWPESIPKEKRIPLATGHRSFITTHPVTQPGTRMGQQVSIRGHVLACCERSHLLVESDQQRILVQSGHRILLSNITVILSEIPCDTTGPGISFCFFNDEVLADAVSMTPRMNCLLWMSANYPCHEGVIHVGDRCPAPLIQTHAAKDLLKPTLSWILNRITLPMWKLCLRRVVCPRVRVQIFLENLVLRPSELHAEIMEKFPGGKNALLREMRHLKMPGIASLVDQRRMELCYAWRTYGKRPFADILPALKVSQPKRFLARYERWLTGQETVKFSNLGTGYSDSLLAAHTSYLPSFRGQYWQLQNEEASRNRYHHRRATDPDFRKSEEWNRNLLARDGVAAAQPPPAPPKPSGEVDPTFWEMKSTGVKMLIAAEELSSIPGLEGCDELLLAA
jgi:hypothetical protein